MGNWYVAPLSSPPSNPDGSLANPWATVSIAVDNATAGDIIYLLDGSHGPVVLTDKPFASQVFIISLNLGMASMESLDINGTSSHLSFISIAYAPVLPHAGIRMIEVDGTCSYINLDRLTITGNYAAGHHMDWTPLEWLNTVDGILIQSSNSIVRDCVLTGVYIGISSGGEDNLITGNTVDGFGADAFRSMGDRTTFNYNHAQNCFSIDANHDDGFQSWATDVSGSVDDLTFEYNTMLEWVGDPAHALRGEMQGCGLFDGWYDRLKINYNLIQCTAPHGIATYGVRVGEIMFNTLVDTDLETGQYPRILSNDFKGDIDVSNDVRVENNVANQTTQAAAGTGNTNLNNLVITNYTTQFVDAENGDFTPAVGEGLDGGGHTQGTPAPWLRTISANPTFAVTV